MSIMEWIAYLGPMSLIAGAAWRASAKLTSIEHRLRQLEERNRQLRAEVSALRTLLTVVIDSRRVER
jgi:hypothetical protein